MRVRRLAGHGDRHRRPRSRPRTSLSTAQVRKQVLAAIAEADALLFVVDGREGLTPLDQEVARLLRRVAKPVVVAVNKVDAKGREAAAAEVYGLGMEPVLLVSAEHGRGVAELIEALAMRLPAPPRRGRTRKAGPDPDRGRRPPERREILAGERDRRAGPGGGPRRARHHA